MKIRLTSLLLLATIGTGSKGRDQLPTPRANAPGSALDESAGVFEEQLSYCLGLELGRRLRLDGVQVDFAAIAAGVRDGATVAEPMLDNERIAACIGRFNAQLKERAKNMAQAADENMARGEKFLAENRQAEGIETTDSGLQYRVVEQGDGASPGPRDTVRCHYEGKLIGGEVFDSSYMRGEPATFPVNGVIAGWTEALQMMKVGAKWEVFLPPQIAYGARGAGGAIGPNETLIFQIELLGVVE